MFLWGKDLTLATHTLLKSFIEEEHRGSHRVNFSALDWSFCLGVSSHSMTKFGFGDNMPWPVLHSKNVIQSVTGIFFGVGGRQNTAFKQSTLILFDYKLLCFEESSTSGLRLIDQTKIFNLKSSKATLQFEISMTETEPFANSEISLSSSYLP